MKFKTEAIASGTRTSTSALLSKLRELKDAVLEAGGLDVIIEEHGGTGFWDYEDSDLKDVVHFEDSRQASGLAARIRNGDLAGIEALTNDAGRFDATSVSDGEHHGAWAPDYTSDAYKANKADYKSAEDKRAFCEENDIPVRELTGAYLAVRFIDAESVLFEEADEDDDTE